MVTASSRRIALIVKQLIIGSFNGKPKATVLHVIERSRLRLAVKRLSQIVSPQMRRLEAVTTFGATMAAVFRCLLYTSPSPRD